MVQSEVVHFDMNEIKILRTGEYIAERINNKVEILYNKLLYLFNHHAALITRKISKHKTEWYTDCVKMMVSKKPERLDDIQRNEEFCYRCNQKEAHEFTAYHIIEKMMVNQIKNYLMKRKIQPNTQSGFRQGHNTTTAMRPQGFVLGPLLFVYTQLYISFKKESSIEAQRSLQCETDKIQEYSVPHGLQVNTKKTQMILFGAAHYVIGKQFRITIGKEVINSADVPKDL
nr:unnamed protein product [Callosobruchus analis]